MMPGGLGVHRFAASGFSRIVSVLTVGAVAIVLAALIILSNGAAIAFERGESKRALTRWFLPTAASQRAEALLKRGDATTAEQLARRALKASAQNSQAIRVLADIANGRGESAASEAMIGLAARLGWRDGFVQNSVFDRALQEGDMVVASQAGDAMLRTNFLRNATLTRIGALLATSTGRAALADRLMVHPDWEQAFLTQNSKVSGVNADKYADLLIRLNKRGARPNSSNVDKFFRGMISRGDMPQALATWYKFNGLSSDDPARGIVDGGFGDLARDSGPWGAFGWRILPRANISITTPYRADFSNNSILTVEVDRPVPVSVLSQTLALRPGKFEVRYQARLETGDPLTFTWRISCIAKGQVLAEAPAVMSTVDWKENVLTFRVPAQKCAGQDILLIAGRKGLPSAASFDDFKITKATVTPR